VSDPPHALELDTITARWQLALDAADRAVGAASGSLSALELAQWRSELVRERHQIAELLASLARVTGVRRPSVSVLLDR
jgi:hypothetical protein